MTGSSAILRERLRRQSLSGTPLDSPQEVVRALCAVQAQDPVGSMWGIGQRARNGSQEAVGRAIDDGSILRTHVLRPTWHFVLPSDIRWMLALTGPRIIASTAGRRRQLGLDDATLRRALADIERRLSEGALTRPELASGLSRTSIDPSGQRLPHLLMYAELSGLVCSGPRRGGTHSWALLDDVVAPAPGLERGAALPKLALRYFAGHGPATLADFSWWSGLAMGDCREAIALAGDGLDQITVGGRTYWRGESPARVVRFRKVWLLPHFDEYFIAYKEREVFGSLLPRAPWPPAMVGGHTVVIDGFPVGTWRRHEAAGTTTIHIAPARSIGREERAAIEAAATRLGRHLGTSIRSVEFGR